ncbi:MAG: pitrilysin family protein [Candidatus Saccharibacteria bacterium]
MKHTIKEITLSSGTKGLLIDVPNSEVLNMKLYFRGGFQFGDFKKFEAPHLIEHHIFNATKNFPKKNQIMVEFAKNGAGNNAFTSSNFITYLAECAEFEYEHIFDLMMDLIANPMFPKEHYANERENVRTELTGYLSDYARQTHVLSSEVNFPELMLNFSERIKQLDSITHEDIVAHYTSTHQSHNANFVITGATKTNEEGIIAKLEAIYSSLPQGERRALKDPRGLGHATPIVSHEDIEADHFLLSWYIDGGDDRERATGRILGTILTGGFGSRIYGKVRDEGLAYHISSGADISKASSSYAFSTYANPDKLERLFGLIASECAAIATHGPTEEELQAAKDMVIGNITLRTQTTGAIAGWYAGDYAFEGDVQSYDDFFDMLRAVDIKMIQKLAAKFFFSQYHSSCHVGPISMETAVELDKVLTPIWK